MRKQLLIILLPVFLAATLCFAWYIYVNSGNTPDYNVRQDGYFALIFSPLDFKESIHGEKIHKGDGIVVNLKYADGNFRVINSEWALPYFDGIDFNFITKKNELLQHKDVLGWNVNIFNMNSDSYIMLNYTDSGSRINGEVVMIYSVDDGKYLPYLRIFVTNSTGFDIDMLRRNDDKIVIYQPSKSIFSNGFGSILVVNDNGIQSCGNLIDCNIMSFKSDVRIRALFVVISSLIVIVSCLLLVLNKKE